MQKTIVALDERELATILAALRYWQREGWSSCGHEQDIASDNGEIEPLLKSEIDDLCETINCFEGACFIMPLAQKLHALAVESEPEAAATLIKAAGAISAMLAALHRSEELLDEAIEVHVYGDDERDPDGPFITGIEKVRQTIALVTGKEG